MSRAIIYTRFSPRRNADESESCETQNKICQRYAADHGHEVVHTFSDKDISGKDEYREKLWQACEALHRGDVLIVFKRDRLARNVYLAEQINRVVEKRKATIEAVSGDVKGNGPEQTMVRQVLSAVAEYERKMIGTRTSYAMRQHQRNGKRMGRYAPYGFAIDNEDPSLLKPVDHEQEAIELIREMVDEGKCPAEITMRMNAEAPDVCRGECWRSKTVRKIIERM